MHIIVIYSNEFINVERVDRNWKLNLVEEYQVDYHLEYKTIFKILKIKALKKTL